MIFVYICAVVLYFLLLALAIYVDKGMSLGDLIRFTVLGFIPIINTVFMVILFIVMTGDKKLQSKKVLTRK